MAQLVDQFGNPLKRDIMTTPQAVAHMGSVRGIRHSFDSTGMAPEKLARVFREANTGNSAAMFELAEQLEEKDAHYQSVLNTRKRGVLRLDFTVEAADASEEAEADAQFVRDFLERDTLQGEIYDILDAIGKGVSFCEIIWDTSESQWDIKDIVDVPQSWFEFDLVDGRTPRLLGDGGERIDLDPYKYIVHYHKSKTGLPLRGGLIRPCAWMWLFKNFAFKDWAVFVDAYGQPIRIGKYDAGASTADREVLLRAVSNIGSDLGAIIPASMSVEFIRDQGATSSVDLFDRFIRLADEQISKAVLGQTTTTDAIGGGLAGNQAHDEVRGDICDSDAVQLSATLNRQLVQPYVYLNRGARKKYPRLRIGRAERVDTEKESRVINTMVQAGAKISHKKIMDRLGLPVAETEDDVLKPLPAAAPPAFMSRDQKALAARAAQPDAIDTLAEELASDFEEITPIVAALEAAAENSTTFEEFNEALLKIAGDNDSVRALAEKIGRATMSARLAGNAGEKV